MAELFDLYERALRTGKVRGGSVRISGAGRVSGGTYESVTISGSATVDGDVEAETVRVAGSTSFRGSVRAGEISISGSAKVEGSVKGELLKASGSLSVKDVIECEEAWAAGSLRARSLKGKIVRLAGAFKIEDELDAQLVELKLSNDSSCRALRGEEVSIERSGGTFRMFLRFTRRHPTLKVELLESKLVRAKDVVIEGRIKADRVELYGEAAVVGVVEGEVVKL